MKRVEFDGPDVLAGPSSAHVSSEPGVLLSHVLQRDHNNLDVVRLIAACMVIYGHANALVPPQLAKGDWVAEWLAFDYSGSLAVKIFFFLSGLVVTNSLLSKRCLIQFALARIWRIWPALLAVLLVSVFILGPMVTSVDMKEFLKSTEARLYLLGNIKMQIQFSLPGVFVGQSNSAVNGSLWSLPYEVGAYCLLAAAFALGVHRSPRLALFITALICVDPLLPQRLLFSWRTSNAGVDSLAPCFAIGALMALYKNNIRISWMPVLGLSILYIGFRQTSYAHYLLYGALFFGILYVCSRSWMIKRRLKIDISYGVYLWGWPVQQLLVYFYPDMGVQLHRVLAIALACAFGVLSWYWVEKPGIAIGRWLYEWYNRKFAI